MILPDIGGMDIFKRLKAVNPDEAVVPAGGCGLGVILIRGGAGSK